MIDKNDDNISIKFVLNKYDSIEDKIELALTLSSIALFVDDTSI
jgi:hypothetical protein